MGRLWLALALVAGFISSAVADRAQVCSCGRGTILPHAGATGVPTNARFWSIPPFPVTWNPGRQIQVYELAPHTAYELTDPRLSFTTGDGPDETPPVPPTITMVSITLEQELFRGAHRIGLLHIAGGFDGDTAVVRVAMTTPGGTITYYTTPDALSVCNIPESSMLAGNVDVAITAIDLAGNESQPVTYNTTATIASDELPGCQYSGEHHHHGTDYIAYFLLAPFVLAFAYLVGLAITANARAGARKTVEATPLAITAAEALARGIKRRAVTGMAIVAGGTALALRSDIVAVIMLFGSPVLVIGLIIEIVRWFAARRALRLASYEGATATVCRDEVRITVGGQHATLRAAPWRVERAKEHGVPRATL